eukprot:scaffold44159_cov68-Cyclotella_meneghiniana.AAC.6
MYNVQKNQTSEPPNLAQRHGGGDLPKSQRHGGGVKNTRATQYCESMKIRKLYGAPSNPVSIQWFKYSIPRFQTTLEFAYGTFRWINQNTLH